MIANAFAFLLPLVLGTSPCVSDTYKNTCGTLLYSHLTSGYKVSTKQVMISWLQALLPKWNITNLTSDWKDGRYVFMGDGQTCTDGTQMKWVQSNLPYPGSVNSDSALN